ncbi:MAG: hypothetical protein GPJ54_17140 [Candidatus Heimdallarchaeota archaeon]|nr:hypothetical protein [Candidatus Heimdallarchaeota archaeon]
MSTLNNKTNEISENPYEYKVATKMDKILGGAYLTGVSFLAIATFVSMLTVLFYYALFYYDIFTR